MFLTAILILEVSYRTNPFDLSPLKKIPLNPPHVIFVIRWATYLLNGGWVGEWVGGRVITPGYTCISPSLFLEQHFLPQVPDYTPTPTQFSMSQIFSRRPHGPARHFTASKTCFSAWSVA